MNLNQYAIYQLKAIPENRKLRFRPYKVIEAQKLSVRSDNYQQVYIGMAVPDDSPKSIYEKFLNKKHLQYLKKRCIISSFLRVFIFS